MPEVVLAEGTLTSCTFLDDVEAVAVAVGSPVDGDDELQPRAGTVDASLNGVGNITLHRKPGILNAETHGVGEIRNEYDDG
mgnify:CR=1 FL=1